MKSEFDTLYELSEGWRQGALRLTTRESFIDPFALSRGILPSAEPVIFEYSCGSRPDDFVGTGWAVVHLISERFKALLVEERFMGWGCYSVEVHDYLGESISGYHGLSVMGQCGPIEDSRSTEQLKSYPAGPFPIWMGLYFDLSTWDGSDIFMPEGTGHIIVTERVRESIMTARLTNIALTPLPNVERVML